MNRTGLESPDLITSLGSALPPFLEFCLKTYNRDPLLIFSVGPKLLF